MQRIDGRGYFEGEFTLPGDKSITHRAIMFNAGAEGEAIVTGALLGEDCLSTLECMRSLGAKIEMDGANLRIQGTPQFQQGENLNCGNSGTTIRLLTGFLAGKQVQATLYGDASLSLRPMKRVAEPLALLGADVHTTDGHAPLYIQPKPLHGALVNSSVSSAQVKSAVLLAGISADGTTTFTEPVKSRDHTERLLAAMNANISVDGNSVSVQKSELRAVDVCVPADISSAAYFMALGALKGKTLCKNVGVNPTRTGILTAFNRMDVRYSLQNVRVSGGEEIADILVEKSNLRPLTLTAQDLPSMIDELPLIALMCAFADGESCITGAGELRVKESDRIRTTAELINQLGGDCTQLPDGLIIRGRGGLVGGDMDSYLDHRIAMTAAVGMLASKNGGNLSRPECCAISFPDFFDKVGVKLG